MANKNKLLKVLQEFRGCEQITNRRPTPRPAVLYLMALRAQNAQAHAPRQRMVIATDWQDSNIPTPIKIVNLDAVENEMPVVVL